MSLQIYLSEIEDDRHFIQVGSVSQMCWLGKFFSNVLTTGLQRPQLPCRPGMEKELIRILLTKPSI